MAVAAPQQQRWRFGQTHVCEPQQFSDLAIMHTQRSRCGPGVWFYKIATLLTHWRVFIVSRDTIRYKLEVYIISGGQSCLFCSGPEWVEFHLCMFALKSSAQSLKQHREWPAQEIFQQCLYHFLLRSDHFTSCTSQQTHNSCLLP